MKRFEFNDIVLLYKIIYKLIPLQLPFYLTFFDGISRLRSCHLDTLSLVSDIRPKTNAITATNKNSPLYKSFFYRAHLLWNTIPFDIRNVKEYSKFRNELIKFLWKSVLDDLTASDEHDDLLDNG